MSRTITKGDRAALRLLHDTQVSLEKARNATGNRTFALESAADEAAGPVPAIYAEVTAALESWEERFEHLMDDEASRFPIYGYWLRSVRGIGPALASQLLAMLLPPLADRGPSTWYKAAGLTVEAREDGTNRLPRARKPRCANCQATTFRRPMRSETKRVCTECGTTLPPDAGKISWYPRLRRCLHNVATSFVRNGGYYRTVYEGRKERLTAQHAGDKAWPPYRLDDVARWATVKLFLAHLWEMWLEAEGVTGRRAYVIEVLGHPHYIPAPRSEGGRKI